MREAAAAVLFLALVVPETAGAQEKKPGPLDEYRAQALELRLQAFGFGGPAAVFRAGAEVDLGFFGGGAEEIFAGSPAALEAMETYGALRIGGFVLWVVGLTALVSELVVIAVDDSVFIEDAAPNGLFWGLLGGGTVTGLLGAFLVQGASPYLSDAITRYNDDLYERLRSGARPTGPAGVRLGFGARF